MTTPQVAALLGVNRWTAYSWASRKEYKGVRIAGRVHAVRPHGGKASYLVWDKDLVEDLQAIDVTAARLARRKECEAKLRRQLREVRETVAKLQALLGE